MVVKYLGPDEVEGYVRKALAATDLAVVPQEPTEEMVTAAMREFERWAARLLRYPEAQRWHMNDVRGMREAIKAAVAAANQ